MTELNEKEYISTIICSLNKIYKDAQILGKLKPIDIYYLHIVYKLLNSNLELTSEQTNKLLKFYTNISYQSDNICQSKIIKKYQTSIKPKFTQAESTDCNTYPAKKEIVYWQEDYSLSNNDIETLLDDTGYLTDKLSDTYPNFEIGKDIVYNNVGKIIFLALESNTTNYKIIDSIGNDVTHTFTISLVPVLNATLFISDNIYSHGTMNFKIKKL